MKANTALDNSVDGWAIDPHGAHSDCLLDCLVEVARLHGMAASAQALSAGLPLVDHRLTPALLPRAAARAGLAARWVKRSLTEISPRLLPAIVLLKDKRACLMLDKRQGKYLVAPAELCSSAVEVDAEELARDYAGTVCYVRPKFRFDARAPSIVKEPGKHWFWAAVFSNRALYRDAVLAALLINIFAMAFPLFTMNVYDRVLPNNAIETLWAMVAGIGIVVTFNAMLTAARAHTIDTASRRIDVSISTMIMERVLDLRMDVRPTSVGAFAANLRSFETIRDFIASASIATLVDFPFILLFLIVLAWISPWMLFPPLIAVALTLLVSLGAQLRVKSLARACHRASSQRNASLVETLTGIETVKILNAQGTIQRTWEQATRYIAHLNGKIRLISSATVAIVGAMQQFASASVIVLGVYLAGDADISMGGIVAASMILSRCLAPLGQVAGLLMQYQNARVSLSSIGEYMDMPVERPSAARFVHRPVLHGAIEFRDVYFSYPGAAQPVLKGLSFKLEPGEKVAILGRTGSGKSTLAKLLLSLYRPTQGVVLLDGVDVRQIDPADLRRATGYVPQDSILFYGTLKQNIAVGAPHADDAAILYAAREAGVSDFSDVSPDGLDMLVGERGESLSGGQRQSVSVARALINDPPILLLDEPTSNMDNQNESRLRRRLTDAAANKTVLLITHRAAMLDLVSRVIVVDGGRIVADGPKQHVMEALRKGNVGGAGS